MDNQSFPYKNVEQYLDAIGVLEGGSDLEITQARKTFRKLYLKRYHLQHYGKKRTNLTISLCPKDKYRLKLVATQNGKKLAGYIREIALQSLDSNVVLDDNGVDLTKLKHLFSLGFDIIEELQYENEYPELKTSYEKLAELFEKIQLLFP